MPLLQSPPTHAENVREGRIRVEDRSRRRARLVLIVGLLFAVGAGATTFFVANTAKSEAPAAIPTSNIIVAAREIPAKTQITAADLKLVKMNSEVVPRPPSRGLRTPSARSPSSASRLASRSCRLSSAAPT